MATGSQSGWRGWREGTRRGALPLRAAPRAARLTSLTRGKPVPAGAKIDGNTLWVADIFSFRGVNVRSGHVRDVYRMQASEAEYLFSVGLGDKTITLASWFTGTVQLLDRATQKHIEMLHGFKAPKGGARWGSH